MIKCNNCGMEFDSDDDLERMEMPDKEICDGCPKCRTDEYLMDIGERHEQNDT